MAHWLESSEFFIREEVSGYFARAIGVVEDTSLPFDPVLHGIWTVAINGPYECGFILAYRIREHSIGEHRCNGENFPKTQVLMPLRVGATVQDLSVADRADVPGRVKV